LLQNFENAPGFTVKIWLFITHQYYYLYFVDHVVVMRVVSRGLRE
jgi:hypothetical protein